MGSCQTKNEDFSEFSDRFIEKFVETHQYQSEKLDPIYGLVQIWKEKNGSNKVMIISKNWRTEWEQDDFNEEIYKRSQFEHPNLLRLLGWKKSFSDKMCSLSQSYELFAPLPEKNFAFLLENRARNLEFFTENELWYLAQSLVNIGSYLQIRGVFHGDYRPETIIIEEEGESGTVLILDNGLLANFPCGYERALAEFKEIKVYLTPHLMKELKRKNIKPAYNVYNSDVFAIGLVLLYSATLRNPQKFYYNWKNFTVDKNAIELDLIGLQNKYTDSFVRMLRRMLDFDEKRPTFLDLGDNIYDFYHEASNISKDIYVPKKTQRIMLASDLKSPFKQDIEFRQPTKVSIINSPERIKDFDDSFQEVWIRSPGDAQKTLSNFNLTKNLTKHNENYLLNSPSPLITNKYPLETSYQVPNLNVIKPLTRTTENYTPDLIMTSKYAVSPNYYSTLAQRDPQRRLEYYNETLTVRNEILDLERRVRDAIVTTERSIKYGQNNPY